MNSFLFLACLLVCYVVAQDPASNDPLAAWSGTTANGAVFYGPSGNPGGGCVSAGASTFYVVANYTFLTAGVRQVLALSESTLTSTLRVFLYTGTNGFNPAAPCTNFVYSLINQNAVVGDLGSIAPVDDAYYFLAQTYFFVITSSTAGTSGKFALNVMPSIAIGDTTTGLSWTPATQFPYPCTPASVTQKFSTFTWTQPATASVDVQVLFSLQSATGNSVYYAIYAGNVAAALIAANPCNLTALTLISTASEGDRSTLGLALALTAGQIYTIAVSNANAGQWGLQVRLTRVVVAGTTTSGFPQPAHSLPCTASSFTNAGYIARTFTGNNQIVLIDTYPIPSYDTLTVSFPTWTFAYAGPNTAPAACPATSPLIAQSNTGLSGGTTGTYNGPLVFTAASGTYTVIMTPTNGQQLNSTSAVQAFILTGTFIGNSSGIITTTTGTTGTTAPTATTGPTVTSTSTGSSTTSNSTAGPTSGAVSTTATPAPTTTNKASTTHLTSTTTTSDVTALSFSAVCLVAGIVATLL